MIGGFPVNEHTPLLLRRIETVEAHELVATSQHDTETGTSGTHMTIVTTSGQQPEMRDQQTDTRPDP